MENVFEQGDVLEWARNIMKKDDGSPELVSTVVLLIGNLARSG